MHYPSSALQQVVAAGKGGEVCGWRADVDAEVTKERVRGGMAVYDGGVLLYYLLEVKLEI